MKLIYMTLSRDPKVKKKIQPIIDALKLNSEHVIQKDRRESEYRFMITSALYRTIELAVDRAGSAVKARVYFVYTTDIENELMTAVAERRLAMDDYAQVLNERVRALNKDAYHAMSENFASPGSNEFNEDWQTFKRHVYFVQHAIEIEKDGS